MSLNHPPDAFSAKFAEVCEKYLGVFDTGLRCICKWGYIMDHAEIYDPNAPRDPLDTLVGPGPSPKERLDNFRVSHEYYCGICGITYNGSVIEGARKYQPLEKRERPPTARDVYLEAVKARSAHIFIG